MNTKLQELVKRDPLTGLLNKAAMENGVTYRLEKGTGLMGGTLFLLDMDNFKNINDSFGHPCGDYVLIQTAIKMRAVFPKGSMLGRIGGDEFAVFVDRMLDENTAVMFGKRFIQSLSDLQWNGTVINSSCSIGICACQELGISYEQLYQETDCALYEVKSAGKGNCSFHIV